MSSPRWSPSWRRWPGGALLWLPLALSALVWSAPPSVESLKVAYLYNVTRFIDWPDPPTDAPFTIAVIGDPIMAEALRVLPREGRRAEDRPIAIRVIDQAVLGSSGVLNDVQILFIGAIAQDQFERILGSVSGRPILLVGDSPGLARRGVAINFFLKPDILGEGQRLRFEISPAALAGRGLQISSQLYDVARLVP
ncbi:YfiR family protein [Thiocystis violacea]|uniref:YfiR family protein n=1 Tax=Thiocystis violacea TaxID=13725 RepID=UPI0019077B48|nr:YfiR family protein [Thiocystis violacea]MBK1718693.1 hypothetical protein [Thiocystis violacea]